jgi:hypothetical protein
MSDAPVRRLTGEQVAALRFAAHRQLARWSKRPALSAHQRAQRNELRRAVEILTDRAVVGGCALHGCADNGETASGR